MDDKELIERLRKSARHALEGNWSKQTSARLTEAADRLQALTEQREDAVERVARALCKLRIEATDESWERYRQPDSWKLFEADARAALSALRGES